MKRTLTPRQHRYRARVALCALALLNAVTMTWWFADTASARRAHMVQVYVVLGPPLVIYLFVHKIVGEKHDG